LGSDAIVLDVKTGSGAFMKTVAEAERLARLMVDIGNGAGRRTVALITDMDRPLGNNIGNALEVKEAVETLNGKGPEDLKEVCIELAANMLFVAGKGEIELCRNLAAEAIEKRTALNKLIEMVIRQGGDPKVIEDTSKLPRAEFRAEWKAEKSGFVEKMNAERLGIASVLLGAGRKTKEEAIDPAAGIELVKKTRDKVEKGETIAFLYASDENRIHEALQVLKSSIVIGPEPVPEKPMILGRIQ